MHVSLTLHVARDMGESVHACTPRNTRPARHQDKHRTTRFRRQPGEITSLPSHHATIAHRPAQAKSAAFPTHGRGHPERPIGGALGDIDDAVEKVVDRPRMPGEGMRRPRCPRLRSHPQRVARHRSREPPEGPRATEQQQVARHHSCQPGRPLGMVHEPDVARSVCALRVVECTCVGRNVNVVGHLYEGRGYADHRGGQLLQAFQ